MRLGADGVGLELHPPGPGGRLEPHQRRRVGQADQRLAVVGLRRGGEEHLFVPVLDVPLEIDAPELGAAGRVAERPEGDPEFGGPAALHHPALHPPDGVPVAVRVPLVGHLGVVEGAERVGLEQEAVPAVVEGVEDDLEAVVPPDPHVVPAHFARHQRTRVLQIGGDVEVLRVVEHPDPGGLGRRGALVRLLLQETARRRHLFIDGIVEDAVHRDRLGEPEGAEGYPAVGVAADGLAGLGPADPGCGSPSTS